jgi:hypothetical protein
MGSFKALFCVSLHFAVLPISPESRGWIFVTAHFSESLRAVATTTCFVQKECFTEGERLALKAMI